MAWALNLCGEDSAKLGLLDGQWGVAAVMVHPRKEYPVPVCYGAITFKESVAKKACSEIGMVLWTFEGPVLECVAGETL